MTDKEENNMNVIYKYRVPFMEEATVSLPKGADIIRVDGEYGAIWMWAVVDTEAFTVDRKFRLCKTGGEMPSNIEDYTYIGCGAIFIQMELMMYLFEYNDYTPLPSKEQSLVDWKEHQEVVK